MTEARAALGMDRETLGAKAKSGTNIIKMLEEESAIVRTLGLGVDRYNEIVHPEHHAEVLPEWVDPPTEVPPDLRKFLMGK